MNRAQFFCPIAAMSVMACDTAPPARPIELTNAHWTKGDTLWLRVVSTDSAFNADIVNEIRRKEKYVRLTVLETGIASRVEWQEFGVMTAEMDSTIAPGPGELFPSTRLVYACARNGSIDRLLNFQEMRAIMDTLLNIYLEQVDDLPPGMREKLLAWGLDSATLSERVLTDPEIFHRSFGMVLTDSASLRAELDLLDPAMSPRRYRIERTNNVLCDPSTQVSFRGRVEADTVDFKLLMTGIDLLQPMMDTMGPAQEPIDVTFDVCFDTALSMPAYIEQTLRSAMWGYDIRKTTTIYRDERISH
jgi:hypothetical protein